MIPMAALAPEAAQTVEREAVGLSVEVLGDLAGAETAWRALEADGPHSPYARLDWVRAFAPTDAGRLRTAILRDVAGRPCMLLPLTVGRRFGVRVAAHVGGKHANLVMPLVGPVLLRRLGPEDAVGILRQVGRALDVDAVSLGDVPALWQGEPNPFAAFGRPSASPAYRLDLDGDGDRTLKRSMKADARKKLRSKERGLAARGPVQFIAPRDEAEVDALLAAFLHQKSRRFAELGIPDPFAEPAVRAALRNGALVGLADGTPAVELYGLRVGADIAAVLGAAASPDRLSGMILSFEPGETARFSPGEILITRIVAAQCERGRRVFDLGVGDARYKRQICDGVEELVDVVVPITPLGRAYAAAAGTAVALKRRLKADPRAMALLARLRRRSRPGPD